MIEYVACSLVVDDLVFPDGRTMMGMLGGGGPQTAFGMRLWTDAGIGLCGSVGADFPASADAWLAAMAIDTSGVRHEPALPSLRAWQILEQDGRRTQVWRTQGDALPIHLALRPDQVPAGYRTARGFHWGVHPEHPNLALAHALRAAGISVSIEPFREAARPLSDRELNDLLAACDIFSPGLDEAASLVGRGDPHTTARRLAAAGAELIALRMGAEGSLLYHARAGQSHHIPALATPVVDPVGAGNAYCGALLAGWIETGDLRRAGLYAAVAASFLVEQYGLPTPRPDLRAEAQRRLERIA